MKISTSRPLPVDIEQLKQIVPLFSGDFERITDLYFKDTRQTLSRLERAICQKEIETVKDLAHSALGASRMLGMTALGKLFYRLEEMAIDGRLSGASNEVNQAWKVFNETRASVRRFKNADLIC